MRKNIKKKRFVLFHGWSALSHCPPIQNIGRVPLNTILHALCADYYQLNLAFCRTKTRILKDQLLGNSSKGRKYPHHLFWKTVPGSFASLDLCHPTAAPTLEQNPPHNGSRWMFGKMQVPQCYNEILSWKGCFLIAMFAQAGVIQLIHFRIPHAETSNIPVLTRTGPQMSLFSNLKCLGYFYIRISQKETVTHSLNKRRSVFPFCCLHPYSPCGDLAGFHLSPPNTSHVNTVLPWLQHGLGQDGAWRNRIPIGQCEHPGNRSNSSILGGFLLKWT